ncbi:MAG: hypothetical protein H6Q72_1603 [Firmicutes bacterium]|nr:hypothetical protein [Bacillota bacterium]
MRCYENNLNSVLKFPRAAFWIVHILGSLFFVSLGLRLALRKAPLPIIAYRLIKMLR